MQTLKLTDLTQMYSDATSVDEQMFAEMRSNLLLISGEHYAKKSSKFWGRVRDNKQLSDEQKLRLTKNHVQKIVKAYVNQIVTYAPSVTVSPNNESELADQEAANLHHSVVEFCKKRYHLREKIREWADDFVGIGEAAIKIIWDPTKGDQVGYEPQKDEFGQPMTDPMTGQPLFTDVPIFTGDFCIETIHGFNLLRPKDCKNLRDAEWLGIRKMGNIKDLKIRYKDDEEKLKAITASSDETYMVFDAASGSYSKSDNSVLITEYYWPKCAQYPKGYFTINTPSGILESGELPGGVFPIIVEVFDKIQTTPRGRSIVKQLRPYQAEINRAASKMAEHQITLGDDKLMIQNGTKLAPGGALPGVRGITYTGMKPEILAGRDGSQYLAYMQSQIEEMYSIANLNELQIEKNGQLDPYAMLFKALKDKVYFSLYVERFENLLVRFFETLLELSRMYFPDTLAIPAVGRDEMVNIEEFRSRQPLGYQVKIEPGTEAPESKLGKQLVLNQVLQYAGKQLDKDDIGKIMRAMPYGNVEEGFDDFTLKYDMAKNTILALDRGQTPPFSKSADHPYLIDRLTARTLQSSFNMLPPQVQQAYDQRIQMHEQAEAQRQQSIQAMKSEYIPVGGAMVACEIYVNDKENPDKAPKRARVPYQALEWLLNRLEAQGMSLDKLEQMNQGALADMSQMILSGQKPTFSQAKDPAAVMSRSGQDRPGGVANAPGNGRPGNYQPSPRSVPAQPGFPGL